MHVFKGKRVFPGITINCRGLYCLLALLFLSVPVQVGADEGDDTYASMAGAGCYDVQDQTIKLWGNDGSGNPVLEGTRDNNNTTVIQGPDQNWGGTANIMPGLITYDNALGSPDYAALGWGGAASGGTIIIGFEQDFMNGQDKVKYLNYDGEEIDDLPDGTDFMVYGFGFCFNAAFSAERGAVKIYAATADYNPTESAADPDGPGPLGQVTITGDESQWVLISEWDGWGDWDNNPLTPDTWQGNPDHNYGSSPGAYGKYLWGDLDAAGLERARYLKFVLGDGGHYIDGYTGEQNHGRAFFIDAVKSFFHEPCADAGGDRVVAFSGNAIELNGEKSMDIDNVPTTSGLTYAWTQTGGPDTVTLDDPASAKPCFTALHTGVFSFELEVSDGRFTSKDSVAITVVPVGSNQSPVADAGQDMLVNFKDVVTLDGSGSSDPDGDALSFFWKQVSGPDVTLENTDTSTPSFDAGYFTVPLIFELTVTDPGGLTSTDTVRVTVNRPPILDVSRTDETATENLLFILDASRTLDPDMDNLEYEWEQLSGIGVTLSNADQARASFIVPEAAGEVLTFRVTVSDGLGFFITETIEVTIRELFIITVDNSATSVWQVGSYAYYGDQELDKAANALGPPDMTTEGGGNASGFPDGKTGNMEFKFNIPIADGPGNDLTIYHFGDSGVEVQVSIDGDSWVSLGELDATAGVAGVTGSGRAVASSASAVYSQHFDLADYPAISESRVVSMQYLKLIKDDTGGAHYIDGIVGHHTALTTIYAAFAQEADGMMDWVDKAFDHGANALEKPDYDPTTPGVGNCSGWMVNTGHLTLGFDNPLTDRDGPDLFIHHFGQGVTDSDIALGYTDGATTVEVSMDGSDWISLGDLPLGMNGGNILNVDSFDFADYQALGEKDPETGYRGSEIKYVRINKNGKGYTSGKFIDAVEARYAFPGLGNPAGSDMVVTEGTCVTLGRKNPSKDDFDETAYMWTQEDNGSPLVVLSEDDVKNPTFIAPPVADAGQDLCFKLTRINENEFGVSVSFVTITVLDNGITGFGFPDDATTFFSAVSGTPMAIQSLNGTLVEYRSSDPDYQYSEGYISQMTGRPKNLNYGMLDFVVKLDNPGDQAQIRVFMDESAQSNVKWFKYTDVDGWNTCTRGTCADFPDDGAVFEIGRKSVILRITDNGALDDDEREGFVRDPSGPGIAGGWHDDVDNGGSGCFIEALGL